MDEEENKNDKSVRRSKSLSILSNIRRKQSVSSLKNTDNEIVSNEDCKGLTLRKGFNLIFNYKDGLITSDATTELKDLETNL